MRTLLLIDVHALVHRFFHALPPLTSPAGEQVNALYGLAGILLKILKPDDGSTPPDFIAAAADRPEPTFRKLGYDAYKATRPATDDALIAQFRHLPELFAAFEVPFFSVAGFEADDVIGTLVTRFGSEHDLRIVMLSGDRDLFQLVADDRVVMNILQSGGGATVLANEEYVVREYGVAPKNFVDYKGLVGDPSDNIPGARGIGPKAARELLKEFISLEGVYENFGLIKNNLVERLEASRELAFMSRELATIRRDVPLDLFNLDFLATHGLSREKLAPFLTEFGFQSFLARI